MKIHFYSYHLYKTLNSICRKSDQQLISGLGQMGSRELDHKCLSFACGVCLCDAHCFWLSTGPSGHHRTTATIKKVKLKAINSKGSQWAIFPSDSKQTRVFGVSLKRSLVLVSHMVKVQSTVVNVTLLSIKVFKQRTLDIHLIKYLPIY